MTDEVDEKWREYMGLLGDPIRARHMANAVADAAQQIRGDQQRLVDAGVREAPHEREARRAEVLEATARFLDAVAPKVQQVMKVIRPGGRNG